MDERFGRPADFEKGAVRGQAGSYYRHAGFDNRPDSYSGQLCCGGNLAMSRKAGNLKGMEPVKIAFALPLKDAYALM